jgi:hypothetical protein
MALDELVAKLRKAIPPPFRDGFGRSVCVEELVLAIRIARKQPSDTLGHPGMPGKRAVLCKGQLKPSSREM